eukprot:GHRQ01029059.1.p1 GENE.GHRQ01029059.1~~GHRQ01029059.1.p1  ORF type:complete len:117 (-),score=22.14 GHRQ01029059.1:44-394(-)
MLATCQPQAVHAPGAAATQQLQQPFAACLSSYKHSLRLSVVRGGGNATLSFQAPAGCGRCCCVYCHTTMAPDTCAFSDRVTPSMGISTHTSSSGSRLTGMPFCSLPSSSTHSFGKE